MPRSEPREHMPYFLPVLIPGRTEPVQVPCSLPDSWTFDVFLPDRGVRKVSVFWKSSDPFKMGACEVVLALPDPDTANHVDGDPYWVAEDEEQRMQDASGGVLEDLLCGLGRKALASRCCQNLSVAHPLVAIARAFLAECAAFDAAVNAAMAMPRACGQVLALNDPGTEDHSPSKTLLAAYIQWCVDEACKAQDEKAQCQARDYEPVVSY